MKYYIATGYDRKAEHNELRDLMAHLGHELTHDWTLTDPATTQEEWESAGEDEVRGVKSAQLVIILLPGARGTHVELGVAVACGIPVVICSETGDEFEGSTTVPFYYVPVVARFVGPAPLLAIHVERWMKMSADQMRTSGHFAPLELLQSHQKAAACE
tara:strand:+ start:650 stop:1123 length:474 start_codon:yes stop_codon:yes gene_type:complete